MSTKSLNTHKRYTVPFMDKYLGLKSFDLNHIEDCDLEATVMRIKFLPVSILSEEMKRNCDKNGMFI